MSVLLMLLSEASRLARTVDDLRTRNLLLAAQLAAANMLLANQTPFGLTPSELRILIGLACGYGDKHIARQTGVSAITVRSHTGSIFRKLGVRDRTQAAIYAWRKGIVDPGEAWELVLTHQYRQLPAPRPALSVANVTVTPTYLTKVSN